MPIANSTSEWLAAQGHDSVHASQTGLQRASDQTIVEQAKKEGRIVVTCDLDFGDIMAVSGDESSLLIRKQSARPYKQKA